MNKLESFAAGIIGRYNAIVWAAEREGFRYQSLAVQDLTLVVLIIQAMAANCPALRPTPYPWPLSLIPGIPARQINFQSIRTRAEGAYEPRNGRGRRDREFILQTAARVAFNQDAAAGPIDFHLFADAVCDQVLRATDQDLRDVIEGLITNG